MIALDSSAVVAIAVAEHDAKVLSRFVGSNRCLIGWPTVLEVHMVLKDRVPVSGALFIARFVDRANINPLEFDKELYGIARDAFDRFGKGRGHPAKLNFGDCMAYAVAKVHDVALLYKGDDFVHTDIRAALP